MDLVDRQGLVRPVSLTAGRQPVRVTPGEIGLGLGDAGRLRPGLEGEGIGIDFDVGVAVLITDLEFVQFLRANPRQEQLPDPRATAGAHGVDPTVPGVEVPDHAHPLGVGGPDGELHAGDAGDRAGVGAQEAVGVPVPPLAEEVQVEVGELGRKGVGVDQPVNVALPVGPVDLVARRDQGGVALPDEQVRARQARDLEPGAGHPDPLGLGQEEPQAALAIGDMPPQHVEGVVVAGLDDAQERLGDMGGGGGSGGHDSLSPVRRGALAQRGKMVP